MAARGHLIKRPRKNGGMSYTVRLELPNDPVTGARRSVAETFHDADSAEKWRTKTLAELDGGTVVLPSMMPMRDLCRRWLVVPFTTRVQKAKTEGRTASPFPNLGFVMSFFWGA